MNDTEVLKKTYNWLKDLILFFLQIESTTHRRVLQT